MAKAQLDDFGRRTAAEMYNRGLSASRVGKSLGVSEKVVLRALSAQRVGLRKKSKTYTLNEDAFVGAELDELASYFAGLLFADGCVHSRGRRGYSVSLSLSGEDGVMVEQFKAFLGTDQPVTQEIQKTPNHQTKYRLVVQSARLFDSLAVYGIHPRKSATATAPSCMLANRHWWRGCIDGDGWIITQASNSAILGFCGSKASVEQFADYAASITRYRPTVRRSYKSAVNWRVIIHGQKAILLLRALYEDCSVAMPRKQDRARRLISANRYMTDHWLCQEATRSN